MLGNRVFRSNDGTGNGNGNGGNGRPAPQSPPATHLPTTAEPVAPTTSAAVQATRNVDADERIAQVREEIQRQFEQHSTAVYNKASEQLDRIVEIEEKQLKDSMDRRQQREAAYHQQLQLVNSHYDNQDAMLNERIAEAQKELAAARAAQDDVRKDRRDLASKLEASWKMEDDAERKIIESIRSSLRTLRGI